MSPRQYRIEREKRGTPTEVSKLLHVSHSTIMRRENGTIAITEEARMALLAIPEKSPAQKS